MGEQEEWRWIKPNTRLSIRATWASIRPSIRAIRHNIRASPGQHSIQVSQIFCHPKRVSRFVWFLSSQMSIQVSLIFCRPKGISRLVWFFVDKKEYPSLSDFLSTKSRSCFLNIMHCAAGPARELPVYFSMVLPSNQPIRELVSSLWAEPKGGCVTKKKWLSIQ